MKSKTSVLAAAIAASGLVFATSAIAASASHLPQTHMQGDISYLSGGIGKTEASAMKHAATRYPLELEFVAKAKPKDEYLANIKVKIKDAHDKLVLDTTAAGPFLLAKMPAGRYTVSADHNGKMEHRTVEIAPKMHKRVVFVWKS
jgi:hypothetical protein